MCEHIFKEVDEVDTGSKYPTVILTHERCIKCGEERDNFEYNSLVMG